MPVKFVKPLDRRYRTTDPQAVILETASFLLLFPLYAICLAPWTALPASQSGLGTFAVDLAYWAALAHHVFVSWPAPAACMLKASRQPEYRDTDATPTFKQSSPMGKVHGPVNIPLEIVGLVCVASQIGAWVVRLLACRGECSADPSRTVNLITGARRNNEQKKATPHIAQIIALTNLDTCCPSNRKLFKHGRSRSWKLYLVKSNKAQYYLL